MASMVDSENVLLKEKVNRNMLYVGIFSIVMLFAGLTSAYIVRQADGQWLSFSLPPMFWVSSVVILLSSISMHYALISVKKDNQKGLKLGLLLTILLGVGFGVSQFLGWAELVDGGIYFAGKSANPSGSFLYALSGLHLAHIISGLIYLLIVWVKSQLGRYNSGRIGPVKNAALYWHFLDGLWIYLFIFLLFMQ
jgi:cytochrome c oxidase subunit 3